MAEGALIVLVLLFGIACTVGLYALIASETSNPTVVDRETAEREAKERGGLERNTPSSGPERDGRADRSRTSRDDLSATEGDEIGWDRR
jgi:hypothetical protein